MRLNSHPQRIQVCRLSTARQKSICDHFQRLNLPSRRARFCGAISDGEVLKYAQKIFRHNAIVCGGFVDGQLRGVVELRGLFQSWPSTVEAAFSVEPDWQNIGIGDALFERMFAMARNRGVRTIQMICLKENSRMRHLAAKHDARLQYTQGATEAVLHPCWPTPASMVEEIVGETKGYSPQGNHSNDDKLVETNRPFAAVRFNNRVAELSSTLTLLFPRVAVGLGFR